MRILLLLVLAIASPASPLLAQTQAEERAANALDAANLLDLARVVHLPPEQRARELHRIFRAVWVRHPCVVDAGGVDWQLAQLDARVDSTAPEDFVAMAQGSAGLRLGNCVFDVCKNLLGPHTAELAPIVKDSLQSNDPRLRYAAVQLVEHAWSFPQNGPRMQKSELRLSGRLDLTDSQRKQVRASPLQVLLDPIFDLWMKHLDDQQVTLAAVRFQSPRVRDFLIKAVVTGKDRYEYANYLSRLIAHSDPPPDLLKALSAPEVRIRRAAAESLYDCGSRILKAYIKPMTTDMDSNVRISAAILALKLPPSDWPEVRPAVLSLMRDKDADVSSQVTGMLVDREGKKLVRTVLALIQDDMTPQVGHMRLYQAMVKIAGTDFGYQEDFRGDRWRPSVPANREALSRFADWVDKNAPKVE